jgi:galactokinase
VNTRQPGLTPPDEGAAGLFAERFGAGPSGIWQAPGRVNLIGEHTDYNDGFALPFAISSKVSVAAARRHDDVLVVTSGQEPGEPVTVALAGLEPGSVRGWAAYPAGVAWALRRAGYPVGGVSLAVDADLAIGSGLSSSAALECATALAMVDLHEIAVTRTELARLARRAENDFVGAPTGIMDQTAVLGGAAGHVLLLDCRTGGTTQIPFGLAGSGLTIVIIDTRARHELTDGGYASRRACCEEAARLLGVTALRDIAGTGAIDRLTDPVLRRRARHVVTENDRVLRTAELLRAGRLSGIGPLLTASHASLRDDFDVSWPQADAAVESAIGAGALGARMTGGGFGGSVIALAPVGAIGAIASAVTREFASHGWQPPGFSTAAPSASARRRRLGQVAQALGGGFRRDVIGERAHPRLRGRQVLELVSRPPDREQL